MYFCVRNIYIFFIPSRKPETHEKAILIASEPKLLVFWGVKSETSEKNPEIIASEPKCSYFRVGFFFTTDQKTRKSRKSYILIASEPKFLVFLGLKHDSPQYFVDKSHGLSVQ